MVLLVVFWLLVLAVKIEDEVLACDLRACGIADEVPLEALRVHARHRDVQHQSMRSPVREVHVCVEVLLDELYRVGLQIAPLVLVPEARRCDLGARRDRAEFRDLLRGERAIERDELVALVLAHVRGARPIRVVGAASKWRTSCSHGTGNNGVAESADGVCGFSQAT